MKTFAYPRTGERNAACRVGVVPAAGGTTRWLDVPGDTRTDFYVPRMDWAGNSNELVVQRVNRLQNAIDVMLADAATGAVRMVLTERDGAWLDVHDDAVEWVGRTIGRPVDVVITNEGHPSEQVLARYRAEQKEPLALGALPAGCEVVTGGFWHSDIARHHRGRLSYAVWAVLSRQVGGGVPHYPVFLLIGLVHFTHFSKSASSAMRVLHRMRGLAVNAIFPKDVLVYSALIADLPEFVISMALTVAIAVATGVAPSASMLAVPLVVAIQVVLMTWVALVLSIWSGLDYHWKVLRRLDLR